MNAFKHDMKEKIEKNDLDKLSYFLEMQFTESKGGIFMHKNKYISCVLKMFLEI